MEIALSPRQAEVLGFIRAYVDANGKSPTIREIGTHFNIRSTNGVADHLRKLERKGWVKRPAPGIARGLVLVDADHAETPRCSACGQDLPPVAEPAGPSGPERVAPPPFRMKLTATPKGNW